MHVHASNAMLDVKEQQQAIEQIQVGAQTKSSWLVCAAGKM